MTAGTESLATRYFETWRARDFVTFRGPLGQADNAEQCVEGSRGLSQIVEDIVVMKIATDGDDALTWFELRTSVSDEPIPTVKAREDIGTECPAKRRSERRGTAVS